MIYKKNYKNKITNLNKKLLVQICKKLILLNNFKKYRLKMRQKMRKLIFIKQKLKKIIKQNKKLIDKLLINKIKFNILLNKQNSFNKKFQDINNKITKNYLKNCNKKIKN